GVGAGVDERPQRDGGVPREIFERGVHAEHVLERAGGGLELRQVLPDRSVGAEGGLQPRKPGRGEEPGGGAPLQHGFGGGGAGGGRLEGGGELGGVRPVGRAVVREGGAHRVGRGAGGLVRGGFQQVEDGGRT